MKTLKRPFFYLALQTWLRNQWREEIKPIKQGHLLVKMKTKQ